MNIYEKVISDENIYLAIYSLKNSIQNREMIFENDLNYYSDIYNEDEMQKLIVEIKERIKEVIENDDKYLKCKVYFKPKKVDEKTKEILFRPIHQYENLLDCAVAIAMLNMLIYDFGNVCEACKATKCEKATIVEENGKRKINCVKLQTSNIINLIPGNFYGNKISLEPERVYAPWQIQYREYSSRASELFLRYHTTKEYAYEVDIDIVDFFPSIDPRYIISFIMEKLPVYITEENRKYIEKLLVKLLYLEVVNPPIDECEKEVWKSYYKRYKRQESLFENERFFTVGIAQGLTQSYFFANIFMILVDKIYSAEFKGEILYYVDDSVIFTNEINEGEIDLKNKIEEVEKKIGDAVTKQIKKYKNLAGAHTRFVKELEYKIEMHKEDDKSSYTNISDSRTGEVYLTNICRAASQATMEINNSLSDNEDVTLRSRVEKLTQEIEKEIQFVSTDKRFQNDPTIKSYKKKLQRYYKFFKYRGLLLRYREELSFSTIFDPIIKVFIENEEGMELIEKFFKDYNEDIFLAAISFALRIADKTSDKHESKEIAEHVREYVSDIDKRLFGYENHNSSYLYLVLEKIERNEKSKSRLESLEQLIAKTFPDYRGAHDIVRERDINKILDRNIDETLKKVFSENFFEKITYVYMNTSEIKRDILNCVISNIFNIVADDSYSFSKRENRMLTYKEIRMLAYIRNYHFEMDSFEKKKREFLEEGMEKIDYSLLEVLKSFRLFVKAPDRIDDLIKVHQYTCDVWKNGSKYLYFYTLHNQEHAVLLIKNSIELVKSIHFIKLSKMDYYILFIACYLHDISMVTIPSLQIFNDNNVDANEISTRYLLDNDRFSNESRTIKNLLIRYYKELDEYYEKQVRIKHAVKSGQEIRKRRDLDFIETFAREIVAQVSEAHGYSVDEVYKAKSSASEMMYSKKFMQIILRLADLLDISSCRISKPILNNNLENMSQASSFHWISHIVTDRYRIKVCYYDDGTTEKLADAGAEKIFKSYLLPKRITERIDIEIYMNFRQFTEVDSLQCEKMRMEVEQSENCKFLLVCGEKCNASKCNFTCKWVAKKNEYLFDELCELKRYLNDNEKNFFRADLNVRIITENNMRLTSKEFDLVRKELNER